MLDCSWLQPESACALWCLSASVYCYFECPIYRKTAERIISWYLDRKSAISEGSKPSWMSVPQGWYLRYLCIVCPVICKGPENQCSNAMHMELSVAFTGCTQQAGDNVLKPCKKQKDHHIIWSSIKPGVSKKLTVSFCLRSTLFNWIRVSWAFMYFYSSAFTCDMNHSLVSLIKVCELLLLSYIYL